MTATRPRMSTRERILDAALDLFVKEGFGGTTITAVEAQVGLAPGTGSFYRHFPSKEALLVAAVDREVARCRDEIAAAHATPIDAANPRERKVKGLERALSDVRRFDRLLRLMLTEEDRVPELRDAISSALQGSGDQLPPQEVQTVVALAALTGYHLSSIVQGRPFQGVAEADFLEALADLMEQADGEG